jgi:glycosyltransferase involved in cell wall biosynthesis
VIASHLGALAELVEHGRTGLLFEPGSAHDLARHIAWAEAFPAKMRAMGDEARECYERRFTSERNYAELMAIYEDAMASASLRVAV